jgi:uncharacterized membrane protein YphA (DoxX/SURF4 family)
MVWAVAITRVVLGLPFFVFGLDHFLHFMPQPQTTLPENATKFISALASSSYLTVVKVLEVFGGAIVLSGRLVPFGLTILTPIAVNILLFEIFLVGSAGPGLALCILCGLLLWAYRSQFATVFAVRPMIG